MLTHAGGFLTIDVEICLFRIGDVRSLTALGWNIKPRKLMGDRILIPGV